MAYDKKDQRLIDSLKKELEQAQELYDQGQYEEAFSISDRVYHESQLINNYLLTFDAIIVKATIPIQLGNLETIPDLIIQAENLLQIINNNSLNENQLKTADLLSLKGQYYFSKGELDKPVGFLKQALTLREKSGNKKEFARILCFIGDSFALQGEVVEALPCYKQSLILCEKFDFKSIKARILIAFSAICFFSGNIEKALDYLNRSLEISEEIKHKPLIALALNNLGELYREKGNFDGAIKTWARCLEITEEIGFEYLKVSVLEFILQVAIERGDVKVAKDYLKILRDIDERKKTKSTHLSYILNKALILKKSLRLHDQAESADLFKEIIEEEGIFLEIRVVALLNLCDLLIKELQMTGSIEILAELQQYIDILLDLIENRQSYLFMAEIYLLQARISLITFDLKKSQRYLTQAQQIAEQWGLTQISLKIDKEKEEYLRKMNNWKKFKENNAPLSERLELAQLDKHIERMLQNRSKLTSHLVEEKVDVHKERKICMICKGDVSRYIYVCDCNTIYCESCIKALIDLENACWVCETPIDQSKPVKYFLKDEEEINKNFSKKD